MGSIKYVKWLTFETEEVYLLAGQQSYLITYIQININEARQDDYEHLNHYCCKLPMMNLV